MKTSLLITAILALLTAVSSLQAQMIIAGDTLPGESQNNFDGTSYTTSGTISAGTASNSILLVGYGGEFQGTATGRDNLTGVSYGGQPLTQAVISPDEFTRSQVWYLEDPASYAASDTLELTFTNNTTSDDWFVTAAVFSGVDLNNPFIDTADNYTNGTAADAVLSYNLGASSVDTVLFEASYTNSGTSTSNFEDSYLFNASGDPDFAGYSDVTGSGTLDRQYLASLGNNASAAGVALTHIPEPSAGTLIMLTGGLLVLLRRRKNFFI
jgi:hypothetical protein